MTTQQDKKDLGVENNSCIIFKTEYFLDDEFRRIGVVGRGAEMGDWCRPLLAHEWMISGCGARQTLPVTLPRGDDQEYVEFKLVMLDDDNRILHWETEGAENNRKIRKDCLRNSIVRCYWGYKDAYDIEHWNGTGDVSAIQKNIQKMSSQTYADCDLSSAIETVVLDECLNQDHVIDDEDETVDVESKMADDEAKDDECRSGDRPISDGVLDVKHDEAEESKNDTEEIIESETEAPYEIDDVTRKEKPSRFRRFMARLFPCIYKKND